MFKILNVTGFFVNQDREKSALLYCHCCISPAPLTSCLDRKLMGQVKSRKLKYFGHTTPHSSLEKAIMIGTMPGKRRQRGQKKQWLFA